ncbi:MAG: hypothetical protein JOZ96_21550 [Acidobacteria bacterium]|nr:hypothetical protein [Acidobacteriota bacterium]
MKRFPMFCCVFVTLAAGVCAQSAKPSNAPQPLEHGGKIETNYDGFAHETVVSLKRMSVTCEMAKGSESILKGVCVSLQAALRCPGKQLDYVRSATLRLNFETKDWDARHNPSERDLTAVADGETLRLGRMTLVTQGVGDGWADEDSKEALEVAVPYETFRKLARAGYVEFSVGKTAFALRDKNVAALRDMNNRVKLPPATAGAGN